MFVALSTALILTYSLKIFEVAGSFKLGWSWGHRLVAMFGRVYKYYLNTEFGEHQGYVPSYANTPSCLC